MSVTQTFEDNRLLVVDDEQAICSFIGVIAREQGFCVRTANDGAGLRTEIGRFNPNVIVLDLNLPGCDGIEMIRYLANRGSDAKVILISGEDRRVLDVARRLATSQGLKVADALTKPILIADLEYALGSTQELTDTAFGLPRIASSGARASM